MPANLRPTFFHLYGDIAWFGVLSGSALAFLGVYVARLGASAFQVGLLTAGPAIVGLIFTMPVGRWLRHRDLGRAVFWSAALSRINYLWWFVLPLLPSGETQIWAYVWLVLLMTIPGTVLAVGFNALYAGAVPPEWRGHVAGVRNAVLALVYLVTTLVCGYLLSVLPLTTGYQVVFAIGFVGAAMSTLHVWYLRDAAPNEAAPADEIRGRIGDLARPGTMRIGALNLRMSIAPRLFTRGADLLRPDLLRGNYGQVIATLFAFHFAQYVPIPLFPLFWVDELHFTDFEISIGTAAFFLAVFLGSLPVGKLAKRWGYHRLNTIGGLGLSLYPLFTAFTPNLAVHVANNLLGGLAWALIGGALANFLLEKIPASERPAYLAWYNLALNAAILAGSLCGSILADQINLSNALIAAFFLRFGAGFLLWRTR